MGVTTNQAQQGEVPNTGRYIWVASSDAVGRDVVREIWHHAERAQLEPEALRQTVWPEVTLVHALRDIAREVRRRKQEGAVAVAGLEVTLDPTALLLPMPSREELQRAQARDSVLGPVTEYVGKPSGELLEKVDFKVRGTAKSGQFEMVDGTLMRKNRDDEVARTSQIAVPGKMKKLVLAQYHEGAAHLGRRKTLEAIARKYWWVNMEQDVRKHVKGCAICNRVKQSAKGTKGFQVGMRPRRFMETVHIDGYGPFVASANGYRYALTIVEPISGYVVVCFLAQMDKVAAAMAFFHNWIARFGSPRVVVADRGSEFMNAFFRSMLKLCGIGERFISTYNPRANSAAERPHRVFRTCITIGCARMGTQLYWDFVLSNAVFHLMNTPQEGRKFSPNEILYGMNFRNPLDAVWEGEDTGTDDVGLDLFVGGRRRR